ncbi:protein MIS12 homolog [Pimephales promelas]|uniref:protein MIS12 homolog n=1 Tax=Pimephales promelas TaxID=90988 RepID=UPI001955AC8E|nr:protein MIS12 homolog [Pimephales promelas]KAG1957426.1 protein MIS12 [Pimephales promelas]
MAESGVSVGSESLQLYEAQFFGFTPETCTLRVRDAFRDSLNHILVAVESVFVKRLCPGRDPPAELRLTARECTQKLRQFLQERFEVMFQRMKGMLVDRVLSVPQNVLLPDDQLHQKHPAGKEELTKLQDSVAKLLQAYEAEVCAKQALLAELEEQKETQKQIDEVLRWIEELGLSWRREGMGSVQDSVRHMVETVGQLQDVVGKIRKQNKGLDEV